MVNCLRFRKLYLKILPILNTKALVLYLLLPIGLLFTQNAVGQSTYQLGLLPSLNINKKFKNDWSINAKIESRQRIEQGDFNGNVAKDFKYLLTDLSFIAAKKVGLNSRIAGGYLIRLTDDKPIHRLIQQFTAIQNTNSLRLSHRLACDQTFSAIERPLFRVRYRLSSEIPLNGQSVDPNEFYLKANLELLNSFQQANYDLEFRVVPLLGYEITGNNKIEIGIDYRVNTFLNNYSKQSFWINLNWFVEMD